MDELDSAMELLLTLMDNISSADSLEDLELALQAVPLMDALRAFVIGNPVVPLSDLLGPPLVVRAAPPAPEAPTPCPPHARTRNYVGVNVRAGPGAGERRAPQVWHAFGVGVVGGGGPLLAPSHPPSCRTPPCPRRRPPPPALHMPTRATT